MAHRRHIVSPLVVNLCNTNRVLRLNRQLSISFPVAHQCWVSEKLSMLSLYRIRILRILRIFRKLRILKILNFLNLLTYILLAIYKTTNPHNRFFFYRLCGFPNSPITSSPHFHGLLPTYLHPSSSASVEIRRKSYFSSFSTLRRLFRTLPCSMVIRSINSAQVGAEL